MFDMGKKFLLQFYQIHSQTGKQSFLICGMIIVRKNKISLGRCEF